MNFEERVLKNEFKLTDTDDQIIDYIRENYKSIFDTSIQAMAVELYVVPNTIVRFAKKLGYESFSELKYALKHQADEEWNNNIKNLDKLPTTITKTIDILDMNLIAKVAAKIKNAKSVTFTGIGDSIYFCEIFCKNLRCLGIKSEYYNHRHDMIYYAENCCEKDLFVSISVSGESKAVVEVSQKAKDRGASVVSITHLAQNSLIEIADVNLFFWAPRININDYNATDRIGIMLIIRLINEELWKEYRCIDTQ